MRLPFPPLGQVAAGCIKRLLVLLGLEASAPGRPGALIRCRMSCSCIVPSDCCFGCNKLIGLCVAYPTPFSAIICTPLCAPSGLEALYQLRRSPNSSNKVFRSFGIGIKSATRLLMRRKLRIVGAQDLPWQGRSSRD